MLDNIIVYYYDKPVVYILKYAKYTMNTHNKVKI